MIEAAKTQPSQPFRDMAGGLQKHVRKQKSPNDDTEQDHEESIEEPDQSRKPSLIRITS